MWNGTWQSYIALTLCTSWGDLLSCQPNIGSKLAQQCPNAAQHLVSSWPGGHVHPSVPKMFFFSVETAKKDMGILALWETKYSWCGVITYKRYLTARLLTSDYSRGWCIIPANTICTPVVHSQQTRDAEPLLVWCWADVTDGAPTSSQHWFNASCLLE